MFYLSKSLELLDTLLLAARNKRLSFLHMLHHAIVMPLFCIMLEVDATNV